MSHVKKYFEIVSLEWLGAKTAKEIDWKYFDTIEAYDHEDAAVEWAELDDQDGDYSIIGRGSHGPILVREEGFLEYQTFMITAESCPKYYASKQ